ARGFTRFTEQDDFGPGVLGSNGFALSELGETVYLSSATGGLRKGVKFGAAERAVSFGRWTRSDGETDFTALESPTPNASNSVPGVGPVVISEIMYNPAAGGHEFIELCNATTEPVPLYGLQSPSVSWELDGAVEYTFPSMITLQAGEYILITGIEPETFRELHGINASVRIFGPFGGDLNNGGESVKLYKPGGPEPDGSVPRLLVDRVQYDDDIPWPEPADNGGASLERISCVGYGNEPTNWLAVTLGGTPGASNNIAARPGIGFRIAEQTVHESHVTLQIELTLFPPTSELIMLQASVLDATATRNTDFSFDDPTVVFWPHETNRTIELTVLDDTVAGGEADETVTLALERLSGNARFEGRNRFTLTIVDDDTVNLPWPGIDPAGTTTFLKARAVTMWTTVPGGVVRYTDDGSEPDINSRLYTGPILIEESTRLRAAVFLGSAHRGASLSARLLKQPLPVEWQAPPLPAHVMEVAADAENADGEEESASPHLVSLHRNDIRLGDPTYRTAGFHFRNVSIPVGAVITRAWIQFNAWSTDSTALGLSIRGEKNPHASAFRPDALDLAARPKTTSSVLWSPPAWAAGQAGVGQATPDLREVVQEIVSQPDWALCQSMAFFFSKISGSGIRRAWSYDGDQNRAAVLHIEYIPDGQTHSDQGTPIWWLWQHYPTETNVFQMDVSDTDADGFLGWEEYIADTIPTNPASYLRIIGSQHTLRWLSETTRVYSIYRSTNMLAPWPDRPLVEHMPGTPGGTNEFHDPTPGLNFRAYRVGVSLPE
ncbi:MAG: chitobiase/beta-hexosaminidase C-terminal domain-containing protein, partial [Verrucomicrobiota bacterium]